MGIDITIAVAVLRVVAAALAVAAVLCWARAGSAWLAAGLFAGLAALAAAVRTDRMTSLDAVVETWLNARRPALWRADAAAIFDFIGQPLHVAVAVMFCGALLSLHAGTAMRAVLVAGAVGVGVGVEQTLKVVIGRDSWVQYAHAFPSGHVTGWAAFLGTAAVCLGVGRSRTAQLALALWAGLGVLCVALVALYSHAHVFSDIVGGIVLGGAIVALSATVVRAGYGSRSRRLMRVSIADMPRSRSGLISLARPSAE